MGDQSRNFNRLSFSSASVYGFSTSACDFGTINPDNNRDRGRQRNLKFGGWRQFSPGLLQLGELPV